MKSFHNIVVKMHWGENVIRGARKNNSGKALMRRAVKKVARRLDARLLADAEA